MGFVTTPRLKALWLSSSMTLCVGSSVRDVDASPLPNSAITSRPAGPDGTRARDETPTLWYGMKPAANIDGRDAAVSNHDP